MQREFGKSLNKLNNHSHHQVTTAVSEEEGESDFHNYHHCSIQNAQFSTKNYKAYQKTGKYESFIGRRN